MSTLTDSNDEFHGMFGTPKLLESGGIQANEISTEIESQIQRFKEKVGSLPVYVDGHQHIHVHPDVAGLFAKALKDNNIKVTRFPVEHNLESKEWVNPEFLPFFLKLIKDCETVKPVLDSHGIKYADCFTGLSTMSQDMTLTHLQQNILEAFEWAEKAFPEKSAVTCELMTHPGYPTSREVGGFSWGTDDFGASDDRVHELNILTSKEMAEFYKTNGIQLASHKILLEL